MIKSPCGRFSARGLLLGVVVGVAQFSKFVRGHFRFLFERCREVRLRRKTAFIGDVRKTFCGRGQFIFRFGYSDFRNVVLGRNSHNAGKNRVEVVGGIADDFGQRLQGDFAGIIAVDVTDDLRKKIAVVFQRRLRVRLILGKVGFQMIKKFQEFGVDKFAFGRVSVHKQVGN